MKRYLNLILLLLVITSCVTQTSQQTAGTMVGLQIGTIVGGAVGGVSSHSSDGHFLGTAIGAITGAALGNAINRPQRQETLSETPEEVSSKELKREENRKNIENIISESSRTINVIVDNVNLNKLSGNRRLLAGEYAHLSFDIYNRGNKSVNVYPLITSNCDNIEFSEMVAVEALLPGEGVRYTVTVYGNKLLKEGSADIIISLAVDGDEYNIMHKLKILTEKNN